MNKGALFQLRPDDHTMGPRDARVTLFEYGDFQCPYCGMAFQMLKNVFRQMPAEDLLFVFRNFPLNNVHPLAEISAEAAEAAGAQGKFWEMHDGIYENQTLLSGRFLVELAINVGCDIKTFERDLENETYHERIRADFMAGARSGVNGTPTFFVNGQRYEGGLDAGQLLMRLRERLDPTAPLRPY